MLLQRRDIHDDQARHGQPPNDLAHLIQATVERTLHDLGDRPLPVHARLVRPEAAARYLCVDVDTLKDWRRLGCGPRFRNIGKRVVYDIKDLDAFVDTLPAPTTSRRSGVAQ